jgi:hypothetical protein
MLFFLSKTAFACEFQLTSRKEVLEHQATIAKLGAHMGLRHQFGSQGPCRHQVLQLYLGAPGTPFLLVAYSFVEIDVSSRFHTSCGHEIL